MRHIVVFTRRIALSIAGAVALGDCRIHGRGKSGAGLGAGAAAVSVPTLRIADIRTASVYGGASIARFQVTLSGTVETPVTVQYSTVDGTAVADQDYRPASGTLTFPANGNAPQSLDVTVIGGSSRHETVTFSVILSNPVNATIDRPKATGTIVENTPESEGFDA